LLTDDAKLSKHVRGIADAKMLQLGFNRLFDWTSKWLLKLSIIKCRIMTVGRAANPLGNFTF